MQCSLLLGSNFCGVEEQLSSMFSSANSGGGGYAGKQRNNVNGSDGMAESAVVQDLAFCNYGWQQPQPSLLGQQFGELHFGVQDDEPKKEKISDPFILASPLELIRYFGNRVKRLKSERVIQPTSVELPQMNVVDGDFSTVEIMRIAAEKFIQSRSAGKVDRHPWDLSLDVGGLSSDEYSRNVELAEFLLSAAEKVGNEQFGSANRFLKHCLELSSSTGNPVQRIGYYFFEALQARVDAKTVKVEHDGLQMNVKGDTIWTNPNTAVLLACREAMPFCQVAQFAGIQAIVENVEYAKRIHIIDPVIANGVQWTILMQALASRSENPIEHLKITAIGLISKKFIEDTGKRLTRFAESLRLPFSFKMVMESELVGLKRELSELSGEETVAIYAGFLPRSMIGTPNRLDSIMKTFSDICPCVMVVSEVESNQNSPSFVHRFVETLFFYSAYFDCLDTCMGRDDPIRGFTESMYFGEGIKNVVAAEGEERMVRNVNLDAWRKYFARFAMVETELSSSSLCAAKLILKRYPNWRFCTLDTDRKSLVIGWKGTPLHSLSVWKFLTGKGSNP